MTNNNDTLDRDKVTAALDARAALRTASTPEFNAALYASLVRTLQAAEDALNPLEFAAYELALRTPPAIAAALEARAAYHKNPSHPLNEAHKAAVAALAPADLEAYLDEIKHLDREKGRRVDFGPGEDVAAAEAFYEEGGR